METPNQEEHLTKTENGRLMQILAIYADGVKQETAVVFQERPVYVTITKTEDTIEMRLDFNDTFEDIIVNFGVDGSYIDGVSGRDWQEGHVKRFLREFVVMH